MPDKVGSEKYETTIDFSIFPEVKWEWDFFGNGSMVIHLTQNVLWGQRLAATLWFGSKWNRRSEPRRRDGE
jgi:hypothetical protein